MLLHLRCIPAAASHTASPPAGAQEAQANPHLQLLLRAQLLSGRQHPRDRLHQQDLGPPPACLSRAERARARHARSSRTARHKCRHRRPCGVLGPSFPRSLGPEHRRSRFTSTAGQRAASPAAHQDGRSLTIAMPPATGRDGLAKPGGPCVPSRGKDRAGDCVLVVRCARSQVAPILQADMTFLAPAR